MNMRLQTLLLSCALFPASQSQVIASGPKDPAAKALNQTAKAQSPLLKKAVLGCAVVGIALLAAFLAWTVYKHSEKPSLDSKMQNSPNPEYPPSSSSESSSSSTLQPPPTPEPPIKATDAKPEQPVADHPPAKSAPSLEELRNEASGLTSRLSVPRFDGTRAIEEQLNETIQNHQAVSSSIEALRKEVSENPVSAAKDACTRAAEELHAAQERYKTAADDCEKKLKCSIFSIAQKKLYGRWGLTPEEEQYYIIIQAHKTALFHLYDTKKTLEKAECLEKASEELALLEQKRELLQRLLELEKQIALLQQP
jgi:hypothetical protein